MKNKTNNSTSEYTLSNTKPPVARDAGSRVYAPSLALAPEVRAPQSVPLNCKKCNGCVMKDVDTTSMDGMTSFKIRCPHCGDDVFINISVSKHPIIRQE